MITARNASPRRKAESESPWPKPTDARSPNTARWLQAQGPQNALHFFIQRINGGLYVEREEIPRHGVRTCQALCFNDRASFERWCDDDPARFEHPLLHARLKRDADQLWRSAF
jgi:hypothetical protein